jgi:hypothetical protein
MILKLIATRVLRVQLPPLHWSWYEREDTVGQGRRRLIAACSPRISRPKMAGAIKQKLAKAA